MNEASFVRAFQNKLPANVWCVKLHDRFTAGIPDVLILADGGRSLWIEFKYRKRAARRRFKPALSSQQRAWLNARNAQQHPVAVIVGSPTGATVFAAGTWNTPQPPETRTMMELIEWVKKRLHL